METSLPNFRKNIAKLIEISKVIAKNIYFVSLTPIDETKVMPLPWRTEFFYTEKNVKKYNDELEKVCQENKISFIDVYNLYLQHQDYKSLLPDGLHPNAEGHKIIFEAVAKELRLTV